EAPFADDPIKPCVGVFHQFRDGVAPASERRCGKKTLIRQLDTQQVDDGFFTEVKGRKKDARRVAIDGKSTNTIGAARVEYVGVLVELQAALFAFDAI